MGPRESGPPTITARFSLAKNILLHAALVAPHSFSDLQRLYVFAPKLSRPCWRLGHLRCTSIAQYRSTFSTFLCHNRSTPQHVRLRLPQHALPGVGRSIAPTSHEACYSARAPLGSTLCTHLTDPLTRLVCTLPRYEPLSWAALNYLVSFLTCSALATAVTSSGTRSRSPRSHTCGVYRGGVSQSSRRTCRHSWQNCTYLAWPARVSQLSTNTFLLYPRSATLRASHKISAAAWCS